MSTTSNFSSNDSSGRPCSARVEYKDRQGACQREAKYPDSDGIRWWCGLHNPERKPRQRAESADTTDVQIDAPVSEDSGELVQALRDACSSLAEISQTRDTGWPDNTPVTKYKIMMGHMADTARDALLKASSALAKIGKQP